MGLLRIGEILPLRQLQAVQTALDTLVIRLTCARPLTGEQRQALEALKAKYGPVVSVAQLIESAPKP